MPQYLLLLGAGFSRNWGRWLADEAFEYLLSTHQIDGGGIRDLLWFHKDKGGFEEALGDLQSEAEKHPRSEAANQNRARLEHAILQMFGEMNKQFASIAFEYESILF